MRAKWFEANNSPNRTPAAQERDDDRQRQGDAHARGYGNEFSGWASLCPTLDGVARAKAVALKRTAGRVLPGALERTKLALETDPAVEERRGPKMFVATQPARVRFVPPKPKLGRGG
jgi:hypothetical protein